MLQVFKKVEKTLSNHYGVVSVDNLNSLEKPFLICLSAQDNHSKSVFGMIKEGARAARVYTTDEEAARFQIDEFPVDFLGVQFTIDSVYQNNYKEMVERFLYPFLVGEGNRSVEEIIVLARRINFMTYCDGTKTYANIERYLEEKLKESGLSADDILSILRQISLIALGTMVNTNTLKATTLSLIDLNDSEIITNRTNNYKKLLNDKKRKSIYGMLGKPNNILYVYDGSGNHSPKEYLKDGNIAKSVVCGALAKFLQGSINGDIRDIHSERIELDSTLKVFADENHDPKELISSLDGSLDYGGAKRYSSSEISMRQELDSTIKELERSSRELETVRKAKDKKEIDLKRIVDGIKKYGSDTAFYQILVSAGLWQSPADRDIFQEKSDKEIREMYDTLMQEQSNENKPHL